MRGLFNNNYSEWLEEYDNRNILCCDSYEDFVKYLEFQDRLVEALPINHYKSLLLLSEIHFEYIGDIYFSEYNEPFEDIMFERIKIFDRTDFPEWINMNIEKRPIMRPLHNQTTSISSKILNN